MNAFAKDKKWTLICQHKEKSSTATTSPKDFVAQLREGKDLHKVVAHLATSLNGEPKAWAQAFIDEGGLKLIIDLLKTLIEKDEYVILISSHMSQITHFLSDESTSTAHWQSSACILCV